MLLAINKPSGMTSYDVIRRLKLLFPKKTKIWHAWTLDPLATWLMLVWVFSDTKLLHELTWLDKSYITIIDFSQDSDTRDLQPREYHKQYDIKSTTSDTHWVQKGIDLNDIFIPAPSKEDLEENLDSIIPSAMLPLTPFSAKKVDWKKLYEYARAWKPIFIDIEMKVNSYDILQYKFPLLELDLNVWKWTYIRSIGHWLGKQFWLPAVLAHLHRTRIWEYNLMEYNYISYNGIEIADIQDPNNKELKALIEVAPIRVTKASRENT